MDRLNQLRGEAGGSRDSTLDTSSPPSEAFMTANDSSKYFSLSEDSEFDISPIKDVSLAAGDPDRTVTDSQLMPNLSPIGKKADLLDSYKIGKQIEAANILSGGVDIFDDNDNSNDGNDLVIDDNVDEEKSNELMLVDTADFKGDEETLENVETDTPSKDTEVVLQIDGKNVDAIDIGNGLYLYRKEGEEELAAVQIIDDDQQQPSFKFLKVRENAEGNLEVYEEIQIEVPKEVPAKEGKSTDKHISHVPIKDINKVITEPTSNIVADKKVKTPQKENLATPKELDADSNKDLQSDSKEFNFNGKMKFSETRKSPVIGTFTPMTYHSTPNKEGKPLTKTMVDLQLQPSRHSDNVKKTIEVHTDISKLKTETPCKNTKDVSDNKSPENKVEEKKSEKIDVEEPQHDDEKFPEECKKIVDNKPEVNQDTTNDTPKITEEIQQDEVFVDKTNETPTQEKFELKDDEKKEDGNEDIKPIDNSLPSQSNLVKKERAVSVGKSIHKNKEIVAPSSTDVDAVSSSTEKDESTPSIGDNKHDKVLEPKPKVEETQNKVQQPKLDEVSSSQEAPISQEVEIQAIPKEENLKVDLVQSSDQSRDSNKMTDSQVALSETPDQIDKEEKGNKQDIIEEKKSDPSPKPEITQSIQSDSKSEPVKESSPPPQPDIAQSSSSTKLAIVLPNVDSKVETVNNKQDTVTTKPVISTVLNKANPEIVIKKTDQLSKAISNETKPVVNPVDNGNKPTELNKVETQGPVVEKKEVPKPSKPVIANAVAKPINNNHAAVPFGKWTEANRQEFLNKIKESKVPTNHSNGKQIKNSNDLNRRDILKKIDSQRSNIATAKAQEMANIAKLGQVVKKEAPIFINQTTVAQDAKVPLKLEDQKTKPVIITKKPSKQETDLKPVQPKPITESPAAASSTANVAKKESRTEINNQDLIDKTIDDIIYRSLTGKGPDETNQQVVKEPVDKPKQADKVKPISVEKKVNERKPIDKPMPIHRPKPIEKQKVVEKQTPVELIKPVEKPKPKSNQSVKPGPNTLLDDIEKEMNKLHGIPFVERPPHELPQVSHRHAFKTYGKAENDKAASQQSKVPKLLPFVNKAQQKVIKETIDLDSEDEIIEHEPITGDIDVNKKENLTKKQASVSVSQPSAAPITDLSKKEAIITENEFDKFARRNSKTYENCLKVNFDGSESHNVIQTVVEKEYLKICSKPETKQDPSITQPAKVYKTMFSENDANKNYPSKVKMAYQSVMTAKKQLERPITIIEDKPVKVMYVDSNMDYYPNTLNVLGKELSHTSKLTPESDANAISSCDSLDSDIMETSDDVKSRDEIKLKTKHQRKQVLTPVEAPELELIEPEDLGFAVSPKKKRRTDDSRIEKSPKALVPKKSYLLGRSAEDKTTKTVDLSQSSYKPVSQEEPAKTHNAALAIDSLVKAAALIETQSENIIKTNLIDTSNTDSPATPIKRGRGRPRKYPLPEGDADKTKSPSPQKKPRLIDAKVKKPVTDSDEDDSSEEEMIKENWTMGKINENIVCPICGKLFRSENVVFKHVKHCTGPSPNRSDSDKRSPRRGRYSQESESTDSKFDETDLEPLISEKIAPKKRKSKDSSPKRTVDKDDIIVIEDTPIKERLEKREPKTHESRKLIRKVPDKVSSLVCEICGKSFRQLSYLVSHKLQHVKEERKKIEPPQVPTKSVFSCDVCKKEFRKLHHLVQHRIIHNPNAMPARSSRKSSSEQKDSKIEKEQVPKQIDDPSAGFRCEPCDKSFRKLHHLVEHRETHDGINRQKNTTAPPATEKLPPPPQCEVCKKTFRKLHHLIEHKEQHVETSSEKSDDKSVKSSLSTKDIIHECSLCYMVFPNEHSLTKHTVICQRKKKQSAAKALKQTEDGTNVEKQEKDQNVPLKAEADDDIEEIVEITGQKSEMPAIAQPVPVRKSTESKINNIPEKKPQISSEIEKPKPVVEKKIEKETIITEPVPKPVKEVKKETESASKQKVVEESEIPDKIKKTEERKKTAKTPKKKTPVKEKSATVTKRQKSINAPLPVVEEAKPVESSDDDEVRYMLNPDFKVEDTSEGKMFMKVRAKKRNSLQIERPNSKDLVKRRISLQHPPKIPRLKPKPVEPKVTPVTAPVKTTPKVEDPVVSTDSDDSDVKYSFPKTAEKVPETGKEKKAPRQSLAEKRKSLGGIAKRKSMGKVITAKHKAKPSPAKPVKRRPEAEHRCDCGQLFGSAALLSRHATLAHTPPRLPRKRAPPDPPAAKPKDPQRPTPKADPQRPTPKADPKKNDRRSVAHRGVPVPEKMRKLMERNKSMN